MSYKTDNIYTSYRPPGLPAMQGYVNDGIIPLTKFVNTLTSVGDSITNNGGAIDPSLPSGSQNYTCRNYAEVANILSGHKCRWVTPGLTGPGSIANGSAGNSFSLGGIYTEDVLYGGYMAAAVASDANIIVVHIGTNNVNRGDTSAAMMADILAIWRMGTSAGKRVIATTILPRDSTVITGAKLTALNDLNQKIRTAAAAESGVTLCDWHAAMLDANAAAPGTGASQWSADGLHPNVAGGWRMGSMLAPVLASVVNSGLPPDHLPINPADVITPNPFATGNVAGVATSWTLTNVGAPTSITPTKVARAVSGIVVAGEWQQVVAAAATANTDGFTLTLTDSTTADWAVGDIVYAVAEVQADAAGWDCRAIYLDTVMTGAAGVASNPLIASAERTALTVGLQPPPVGGLVLVTPRIQVPASVTAIRAVFRFFGSGTVRVSRIGVRKVTP